MLFIFCLFCISIRAPARGATFNEDILSLKLPISIRAPARGATIKLSFMDARLLHFNPRSREGSDPFAFSLVPVILISIRAPARGATLLSRYEYRGCIISIRAPARGATGLSPYGLPGKCISIRAPARGATLSRRGMLP